MEKNIKEKEFNRSEIIRFGLNGIFATLVHFGVLSFNLNVLKIELAGVANFFAAIFGITFSFFGNRYFVFKGKNGDLVGQSIKFILLYTFVVVLHAAVLYFWTDIFEKPYLFGFLIAVFFQVILSYLGSKYLVFNQ